MGVRGPKPQPASVKKAKGNPGRRPLGEDPVVANADAPRTVAPPTWLKAGKGLEVWKRIAPRLAPMKLLSAIDADTFGRYCRDFARWLKMQERLDKVGEIYEIETASGIVRRPDPAVGIADKLEGKLMAAEANFGLNPAERQRIFASRAATGTTGDLFAPQPASAAKGEAGAMAPADSGRKGSAIGFLN